MGSAGLLTNLIERRAAADPQRPALLGRTGPPLSWADFRNRVETCAAGMAAQGVRPGDRVALLARNGPAFLEVFFAALRVGALIVPMNWRLSAPELADQANDCTPSLWFIDSPFVASMGSAEPDVPRVVFDGTRADPLGDWRSAYSAAPALLPVVAASDDPAGLFYTGGTTGRAKGVKLSHRNFLANARTVAPMLGYRADDVHLHAAPMFHLADLGATIAQIAVGGAHCFLPSFDPQTALETIASLRVTDVMLAPTMIDMVLAVLRDTPPGLYDLSGWRGVLYGGAPITERTLRDAMAALPCAFYQGYGQSEATHTICMMTPEDHRRALSMPALLRTCGRPVAGIELALLDDAGQPVPTGTAGEVAIRGETVMLGYWQRPAETAAALQDGWLRTGDLGILDEEGRLTLVDRKKDMVVTGAENVYSAEVESVLSTHSGVAQVAVIPVPDDRFGERVHAVIVPVDPATPPDLAELQAHARAHLAGYKVPRSLSFASDLPKSAAGKIRKDVLRAPYWEGQARAVS